MSITDELRKLAEGSTLSSWTAEHLTAIADRIDAEHEAKVSYWQGASYKDGYDEGFASADDWLGQHEDAMAAHGWVKLPVDADGEYIRIGDVMERMERCGKVVALQLSDNPWGDGNHWAIQLEGEQAPTVLDAFFHHYHAPTVEDVLREFAEKITDSQIPGVHPTYDEAIAEYAAKLRLADDGEER